MLFVAGWVILFTVDDHIRWDGWAMCLGSAGAVLLLNLLFRYGARGDTERQAEETARGTSTSMGTGPTRHRTADARGSSSRLSRTGQPRRFRPGDSEHTAGRSGLESVLSAQRLADLMTLQEEIRKPVHVANEALALLGARPVRRGARGSDRHTSSGDTPDESSAGSR